MVQSVRDGTYIGSDIVLARGCKIGQLHSEGASGAAEVSCGRDQYALERSGYIAGRDTENSGEFAGI